MEADLSDLSDSWRDTYSANFQISPLPFFLSSSRLFNAKAQRKNLCVFAFDVFRTLMEFEIATPLFPHRYSINSS